MEFNHSGWGLLVEFPRDLSLGFFYLCYTLMILLKTSNVSSLGVFADDTKIAITILKVGRVRSIGSKAFQSCGSLQK